MYGAMVVRGQAWSAIAIRPNRRSRLDRMVDETDTHSGRRRTSTLPMWRLTMSTVFQKLYSGIFALSASFAFVYNTAWL